MNGSFFCRSCGKQLEPGSKFCAACGTPVEMSANNNSFSQSARYNQSNLQAQSSVRQKPPRKFNAAKMIIVLLGIFFLLMALRIPLLSVAGKSTAGVITDVKQIVNRNTSKLDHDFNVKYTFTTDDSRKINSSYRMNKVYNASHLPSIGSIIEVSYLPFMPGISIASDHENNTLVLVGGLVFGILLIFLAIKGKVTVGRRR